MTQGNGAHSLTVRETVTMPTTAHPTNAPRKNACAVTVSLQSAVRSVCLKSKLSPISHAKPQPLTSIHSLRFQCDPSVRRSVTCVVTRRSGVERGV